MEDVIKGIIGEKGLNHVDEKLKQLKIINNIYKHIITDEHCEDCDFKTEQTKKVLPIINSSAEIMIITENASQLEISNGNLLSDPSGKLLLGFLDKLDTDINNIYITPITKCYSKELQFHTALKCYGKFVIQEIFHVKPKLIVTIGELPMKITQGVLFDVGNYQDLKIQDARKSVYQITEENTTVDKLPEKINVIHTISPKMILSRKGESQNKVKKVLWHDLKKIDKFKEALDNKKAKEENNKETA